MNKETKNKITGTVLIVFICTFAVLVVEYIQFLQRIIDSK